MMLDDDDDDNDFDDGGGHNVSYDALTKTIMMFLLYILLYPYLSIYVVQTSSHIYFTVT